VEEAVGSWKERGSSSSRLWNVGYYIQPDQSSKFHPSHLLEISFLLALRTLVLKMHLSSLIAFAFSFPLSLADIDFISPSRGQTLSANEPIKIWWGESGLFPKVMMLETYQLFLCTGGNAAENMLTVAPLVLDGQFTESDRLNVTISQHINPNLDGNLL
jgi:hypothetical protein